jgi:pyruvate/2-oxoglutarate dehydrogenase complex dihydrolipoamide acyltransferase (E2) component
MDQATEVALKAAFNEASERLGRWKMVNEGDADYVIVDMDSMYGPMSWLRLHAAGKQVIGLTTAPRTQADFMLARPFDARQLTAVLGDISGTPAVASAPMPVMTPAPPPVVVPAPIASPPAPTAAPAPAAAPEPAPIAVAPPAPIAVPQPSAPPPAAPAAPPPAPLPVAAQAPAPAPVQAPSEEEPASHAVRNTAFAHWLRPGALTGRARYQGGNGPEIFIDFSQRQYHGPSTLKPLVEYFVANVGLRDFEQLDERAWQTAVARLGAPLPLARLQWLGGLLSGEGKLLPGFKPDGRFVLSKWPETEREYPRHFRIATAMMKGPSTIAEIAAASSVPAADVVDFINANLATGFAEQVGEGAAAADSGKSGGLLDRLRGR